MALIAGVTSAAKRFGGFSPVAVIPWKRLFCKEKMEVCECDPISSLTTRLLQEPTSSIKHTLDSMVQSPQFPLEALLTSLTSSSSSQKARLVFPRLSFFF